VFVIQSKHQDNTSTTIELHNKMMDQLIEGNPLHKRKEIYLNVRQQDVNTSDVLRIHTLNVLLDIVCFVDE